MDFSPYPFLLVVDNDPDHLAQYLIKLEALGYRVCGAASAEEGLSLSRTNQFDAILTDNILPGITGLQSIAEYEKHSDSPILVMTSQFSADVKNDAILLGARACFAKPLNFVGVDSELKKAIAEPRRLFS